MRKAFVEILQALAARDPRVVLLTADLGFNALEPFAAAFPERFVNVGAAEQNMIAVATGLAEAGLRPYCYSIAPFAVLRPFEFLRNGPVAHRLPVRVVGMGGGLGYGNNGLSHHGVDDVGVLRTQPGLAIFTPADSAQTRAVFEATADLAGPAYYRLEKDDSLHVPELAGRFQLGRPEHLTFGPATDTRAVLFATVGGITADAVDAARALSAEGVPAGVAVFSTLQPLEADAVADVLRGYRAVVSVEAHVTTGGLGSALAEVIAERALPVTLIRRGVADPAAGPVGSAAFLHRHAGLGRDDLLTVARRLALSRSASTPGPR